MRILINEKNASKIKAALEKVNGGAHAHTITSFAEVAKVAARFESELAGRGLSKTRQTGVVCTYRPNGKDLPNAYKFAATTTEIELTKTSIGWALTSAIREKKFPGAKEHFLMALSDEQAEIIREAVMKDIVITSRVDDRAAA